MNVAKRALQGTRTATALVLASIAVGSIMILLAVFLAFTWMVSVVVTAFNEFD